MTLHQWLAGLTDWEWILLFLLAFTLSPHINNGTKVILKKGDNNDA